MSQISLMPESFTALCALFRVSAFYALRQCFSVTAAIAAEKPLGPLSGHLNATNCCEAAEPLPGNVMNAHHGMMHGYKTLNNLYIPASRTTFNASSASLRSVMQSSRVPGVIAMSDRRA